jgi:hypothetical protein
VLGVCRCDYFSGVVVLHYFSVFVVFYYFLIFVCFIIFPFFCGVVGIVFPGSGIVGGAVLPELVPSINSGAQ